MRSKQRLGEIIHISNSSGNLILKAENTVKIGEPILNSKGKKVGTIFDLFGPVSSPFIAVKLRKNIVEKYIGEPLFLMKTK